MQSYFHEIIQCCWLFEIVQTLSYGKGIHYKTKCEPDLFKVGLPYQHCRRKECSFSDHYLSCKNFKSSTLLNCFSDVLPIRIKD